MTWWARVRRYGVNWSFRVPTAADTLDPDAVPGWSIWFWGGEAIRQELRERRVGRVRLLNVGCCCCFVVAPFCAPFVCLFTYP